MASSAMHVSILSLLLLATTVSIPRASSRAVPSQADGGATGGKAVYTKVCDASRFMAAGLDMSKYRYCNASLPYGDRVRDLIGWMTVEEKVSNLGDWADGAPRVGLPQYKWWSEALHGLSSTGPTTKFDDPKKPRLHSGRAAVFNGTVFANVINSAASFNESLWKSIGQAISTEARAMYNLGKGGLTYWSPNINVVRDPRWGRALETPGEDPFVVGRYAVNFVRGMQDVPGHEVASDPMSRPLKTSACCKHYAAYDVDDWYGHTRFKFDARVEERDMVETFQRPFEMCVRHGDFDARVEERDMVETFQRPFEMCVRHGDVSRVMCSYNRVNGIPACADARLLSGPTRRDWGLHGYIVSDCDAVRVMTDNATWLGYTAVESTAAVLKAGLDLDCGESWIVQDGKPVMDFLTTYGLEAVQKGKTRESDVDNALTNLYMTLMRLGYFDGMPRYESLNEKDICSDDHRSLALDGARQGMVLLKNHGGLLPLDPNKYGAVAVRGPHAEAPEKIMDGDYTGPPCRYETPREGISKDVNISHHANLTIYFGGINMHIEREGNDREDLLLPKNQTEEILHIAAASPNPIVLVILSGGGIDISFAQGNPKIGAILWAGYPGGEGGNAIADVIFGRYSPGGRLPLTWFKNKYIHQIPMTSMELRPRPDHGYPGRTYKFYDGPEMLYRFGHGLSYTKFRYETSAGNGTAVAGAPIKQVVAFQRVFVKAGGAATVGFSLKVCEVFGIVEKTAYTVVPSGVSTVLLENGDTSSPSSVSFPVKINFST
uniref:Putative beta-D-xylosidase 2 n=1 Tax=Aegilops tauschii TaxID=37682 RepID=M8B8H2_AEGTA